MFAFHKQAGLAGSRQERERETREDRHQLPQSLAAQTAAMSDSSTAQASQLVYFVAGLLCASIATHFARPSPKRVGNAVATMGEDEEWDSDDDGPAEDVGPSSAWGISDAPYKMVLCVNTSLSMGKGG